MNTTLLAALAAAIPSVVIGVVGFLLQRLIGNMDGRMEKMGASIDQTNTELRQTRDMLGMVHTDTATLRVRVEGLERETVQARAERSEMRHDITRLGERKQS